MATDKILLTQTSQNTRIKKGGFLYENHKVLAIMCLSLAAFAPGKAHAANKVQIPDGACRKGNDIYYSYSGSGLRMDLMKINTKTHKKKMIVSFKKIMEIIFLKVN